MPARLSPFNSFTSNSSTLEKATDKLLRTTEFAILATRSGWDKSVLSEFKEVAEKGSGGVTVIYAGVRADVLSVMVDMGEDVLGFIERIIDNKELYCLGAHRPLVRLMVLFLISPTWITAGVKKE